MVIIVSRLNKSSDFLKAREYISTLLRFMKTIINNIFFKSGFRKTIILLLFLLCLPTDISAKYEYAKETGKGCKFCHIDNNGGPLNETGYAFIRNSYKYPIPPDVLEKNEEQQSASHKTLRLIIGYIHIVAAFILVGAIFYIHIIVKPARLTGGIPKAERILGLTMLGIITVTGIYLTSARIDSFSQFFNNTFGFILFIKIVLFIIMLSQGLFAVTMIHRKMQAEKTGNTDEPQKDDLTEGKITEGKITLDNLNSFNGSSGKPAYIAYEGEVYDVTDNPNWQYGSHFRRHNAGSELTKEMSGAPHGPEVLRKLNKIGPLSGKSSSVKISPARKTFLIMTYVNLAIIFLILFCVALWHWGWGMSPVQDSSGKNITGVTCIDCHKKMNPGIYEDWRKSVHSKLGVDCYKCHRITSDPEILISKSHLKHSDIPISIVVSPKTCSGCHPEEYKEYSASKHANTLDIIWKVDKWLQHGMNNKIERTTGCFACHGTKVETADGRPIPGTWPNVGVGRENPDGSLGSCSSCHTRHKFSAAEARKPEACDQCHLGPDHPQIEIYNESKHGTIYHSEGDSWNWHPSDNKWKAGRDFRAPTCSVCHMSAAGKVKRTHNTTDRLSWELQAALTIRPEEFAPFPSSTNWKDERDKMKSVCLQCHSKIWTEDHFTNMDNAVYNYNRNYFVPVKKELDKLYGMGLISDKKYFDESPEWEFYELWHHEGRRARMGAAMMAPDYAWWHGFYELKHRYTEFFKEAKQLRFKGRKEIYSNFPGMLETQ